MTLQFENNPLIYDPLNPPKGDNSSPSGRLGVVKFANRKLEFINIPFSHSLFSHGEKTYSNLI